MPSTDPFQPGGSDPSQPGGGGGQIPDSASGPSSTAVLERSEQREEVEPGDRDRYSHYVDKNKMMRAAINGTPVVALCGKIWVPSRDPKRYPVCPTCKEIYEAMRRGENPGDSSGGQSGGQSGGGFFGSGSHR